jgi:hypothetical protein
VSIKKKIKSPFKTVEANGFLSFQVEDKNITFYRFSDITEYNLLGECLYTFKDLKLEDQDSIMEYIDALNTR